MLPAPVVRVRLGLNRHTTDHKFEAEPAGYERWIMAPTWLTSVAWAYLSLCFICAGIIAYDIAVNRRGGLGRGLWKARYSPFKRASYSPPPRRGRVGRGPGRLATRLSKRASYSPPPRRGRVGRGPWKARSLLAFPNGPLTRSWYGFLRPH